MLTFGRRIGLSPRSLSLDRATNNIPSGFYFTPNSMGCFHPSPFKTRSSCGCSGILCIYIYIYMYCVYIPEHPTRHHVGKQFIRCRFTIYYCNISLTYLYTCIYIYIYLCTWYYIYMVLYRALPLCRPSRVQSFDFVYYIHEHDASVYRI